MSQITFGAVISGKRRELMMTQRELAAQVKRTFTVSASDGECEKTILDFWKDFNKSDNFTVHDRFLLITQRGTNTLLDHFAGLLDCARSAQDAEDFEHRLTTPGFISQNRSIMPMK